MIAVSRDARWVARLRALAERAGWPFASADAVPAGARGAGEERALVVLDRALAGGSLPRAVAALRAAWPSARVALACGDGELGADAVAASLACGADDVVAKAWTDERLRARLSALRDAALAGAVRESADGGLRAERRSRRAYARARGRWAELPIPAAEFALLWRLLAAEGEVVARDELLEALRADLGREVEAETVARRVLCLRRALSPWKGTLESVRGGGYRLASSRRRSTT